MTMLTLFPPTFAVDEPMGSGGKNGTNNAYRAKYWRYHPHAAAIAAHEVREARRSGLILLGFIAAGAAFGAAGWALGYGWEVAAMGAIVGLIVGVVYSLLGSQRAETNLTGEATECVVEEERYGMILEAAIKEGAYQLSRSSSYSDFFDVEDEMDIAERLLEKVPAARKWVKRNRDLIDKAMRLQGTSPAS